MSKVWIAPGQYSPFDERYTKGAYRRYDGWTQRVSETLGSYVALSQCRSGTEGVMCYTTGATASDRSTGPADY